MTRIDSEYSDATEAAKNPALVIERHHLNAEPLEEKTAEEFEWEAHEYFVKQKRLTQHFIDQRHPTPRDAAQAELFKDRVENAAFKELGQLSDILLTAPLAAKLQSMLDTSKTALSRSDLGPAEIQALKAQIKEIKRSKVVFNQQLRDFLFENGDHIPQDVMGNWLAKAAGQNEVFARTTLAGIGAEVAVANMLKDSGRDVRLSTVDEDLHGIDLIVHKPGGSIVKIDVKTGGNQGGDEGASHEVDIEKHMHNNYRILPEFQASLLRSLDF